MQGAERQGQVRLASFGRPQKLYFVTVITYSKIELQRMFRYADLNQHVHTV